MQGRAEACDRAIDTAAFMRGGDHAPRPTGNVNPFDEEGEAQRGKPCGVVAAQLVSRAREGVEPRRPDLAPLRVGEDVEGREAPIDRPGDAFLLENRVERLTQLGAGGVRASAGVGRADLAQRGRARRGADRIRVERALMAHLLAAAPLRYLIL